MCSSYKLKRYEASLCKQVLSKLYTGSAKVLGESGHGDEDILGKVSS